MATIFSSLPIIDLSILSETSPGEQDLRDLSQRLCDVFASTGFAYLVNAPLSFSHEQVFGLANAFFRIDETEKLKVAKRTFVGTNKNTYRGYFPTQPSQLDNLKEGFEVGPLRAPHQAGLARLQRFDLSEPNLESLHQQLQSLSGTLLSLLAVGLGKSPDYFASYLTNSLSTLRMLHYPPQQQRAPTTSQDPKLCCTPHTDSGILTLLHQDPTGGLEVLNADGQWISAPYVPASIVVNIGDLMARVSGGRFVATMHRVRTSSASIERPDGIGRFSVPFFFEPGEECVVRSVDGGESIVYGEYVRRKMNTWVEYMGVPGATLDASVRNGMSVKAY
ncbi:hypothetical protein LTS10_005754 [Elasticomyces elasticus]|nr:hypothetical protein LTS10_005754 [Elasticomyces elasticus]